MKYYFCDNDKHTYQVKTDKESPRCISYGAVMTYGRYLDKYNTVMIVKPGIHETIDGKLYRLDRAIIAV